MNNLSKLDKLKNALNNGDNKTAFSVARQFFFGIDKDLKRSIEIAADAPKNAAFYKSVGVDTNVETEKAIKGLRLKFLQ